MKKLFKNFESNTGFTLIELIISIFILSVAIVGIFNAFSIMTILTSDTADRLTATYLAQEGMEMVRNIRDTNWLKMDACSGGAPCASWLDGLTEYGINQNIDCSCASNCANKGCEADYTATSMSPYATASYLYLNTNGFYGYDATGTKTKFERKIIINPVEDVDNNTSLYHIIKVIAQVSWNEKATIFDSGVSADNCCPDSANPNCPKNVSNCITTEETLYDWYNYPSSNKDIDLFSFDLGADENDAIDQTNHTIVVTLPSGTSPDVLTDLTATFTTTGTSVTVGGFAQISGDTSIDIADHQQHDFSNSATIPVAYIVHAADDSTQEYDVTVTIASP